MNSLNAQNQIINQKIPMKAAVTSPVSANPTAPVTEQPTQSAQASQPAVASKPALNIRTELTTKEEQQKYIDVFMNLDRKGKQEINGLLKSGILLSNASNDKSTTLDNLHKIIKTQRVEGLSPKTILSDTIEAISNPFSITQKVGNIPNQYLKQIPQIAQANPKNPGNVINEESINIQESNSCVSASIEFNLAMKMPAEFARFAEGLTSPKMAVDKTIQLKNLTDKTLDSVWLLNAFEVPYEMKDFEKAKITLSPDKNAILRAQIQNNDKDPDERSVVDVLMQSTFMNIAAQQSYDSLTDTRGGKFNEDNRGLIEFEKTFTESIVEDKNKISVNYQILDENEKITGYTKDFKEIEKELLKALSIGESVIIGYTAYVKNKELPTPRPDKGPEDEILLGHEITIVGAAKDKTGKMIFICNDTDDSNPNPILYPAEELIPKIHHAGLPQEIVAQNTPQEDSWKEGVQAIKQAKSQKAEQA